MRISYSLFWTFWLSFTNFSHNHPLLYLHNFEFSSLSSPTQPRKCSVYFSRNLSSIPWSVTDPPGDVSLKKTNSPSLRHYQMPVVVGFMLTPSFYAMILSSLSLHRSCACVWIAVNSYMQLSCCVRELSNLNSKVTHGPLEWKLQDSVYIQI